MWQGVVRPWHIILIAFLFGIVLAFDMPARQSFFIEMTSRAELANAISLNSSIVNGARIVGPAVAGAVMAQSGIAFCFFLNGLSFIVLSFHEAADNNRISRVFDGGKKCINCVHKNLLLFLFVVQPGICPASH